MARAKKNGEFVNCKVRQDIADRLNAYSEKTMILYASFIIGLLNAGRNLAIEVMGNTAKLYGFDSLLEAEQKQS